MISYYRVVSGRLETLPAEGTPPGCDFVWVDLCDPTREEELAVETTLGLQVPNRQEMAEIEESSRLYAESGALVMTAVVVDGVASGRADRTDVTFVLSADHLVTVRYSNPTPFRTLASRLSKQPLERGTAQELFVVLVEAFTARIADVLELVAADLDAISDALFDSDEPPQNAGKGGDKLDLQALIRRLGRKNRLLSILRESLLSFGRLVQFLRQAGDWLKPANTVRLKAAERDIRSLAAYEAQLEQQIAFLHEATLGLINIEQNDIIRVFSIAAVLFLPPTLVGTIYGMNFDLMPELTWRFGYPLALAAMVISAVLPLWWFRRRGWL